jgi:hypothetical protein
VQPNWTGHKWVLVPYVDLSATITLANAEPAVVEKKENTLTDEERVTLKALLYKAGVI